jgi:hypothetical protein
MAERDGAAVVCHNCKGTGKVTRTIAWEDFKGRGIREGVKRVYAANPGIMIGENDKLHLEDFGGMPYRDWVCGQSFPEKSEDRKHTCPQEWYQHVDSEKKPYFPHCSEALGRLFRQCCYFSEKDLCWEKFDKKEK